MQNQGSLEQRYEIYASYVDKDGNGIDGKPIKTFEEWLNSWANSSGYSLTYSNQSQHSTQRKHCPRYALWMKVTGFVSIAVMICKASYKMPTG